MVYVMYDWTVKAENPGFGFANTKKAIAFTSTKKRDDFLESRAFDLSAKKISRKEAVKMSERIFDSMDKGLPVDSLDYDTCKWVTLYKSKY